MLYRPHFCCHCGEKIIRAKWTPLTSRRFCEFCAIEQKQHDLVPRAVAVVLILFGAAGFTAYIGSGSKTTPATAVDTSKVRELRSEHPRVANVSGVSNSSPVDTKDLAPPESAPASSQDASANIKQRPVQPNSSTQAVYYCGAMTKKGTPCTRRVKAPGRCWQHIGQPAMTSRQN